MYPAQLREGERHCWSSPPLAEATAWRPTFRELRARNTSAQFSKGHAIKKRLGKPFYIDFIRISVPA